MMFFEVICKTFSNPCHPLYKLPVHPGIVLLKADNAFSMKNKDNFPELSSEFTLV